MTEDDYKKQYENSFDNFVREFDIRVRQMALIELSTWMYQNKDASVNDVHLHISKTIKELQDKKEQ